MKKIIFWVISLIFITTACDDDIFDRQPLDKISDEDLWNNAVMLESYLNDIYSRMLFNDKMVHGGLDTKTDIASTGSSNLNAVTQGTMSKTSDALPYWDYAVIRAVNIFIERIKGSTVVEVTRNQLEGEARVLRAMIYFEKQKRYGGVPLVDVPLDPFNPIDNQYTRRSTEEAIADFIDADLTISISLLKEDPKGLGTINKWTAYALKARANLWAASIAKYGTVQINGSVGIPSGRANEFYTKASAAANAVIQSGNYSLYNKHADKAENYRLLFLDKNNGEAIFSKIYDGVNQFHRWSNRNAPTSQGGWGAWDNPTFDYILACENIDGSPDQPLIGPENLYDYASQAFEQKDPRVRAITLFDGEVYKGQVIRSYEGIDPAPVPNPNAILSTWGETYMGMPQVGDDSRLYFVTNKRPDTGLLLKKLVDENPLLDSDTPFMEFRLGEMYLTRAEAEFELGNLEPAAAALNATRERAGVSLVTAATITRNHVRTERMSELAWEQHRWWDLRRWRNAENVLNLKRIKGLRTILHYETGKFYFLPVDGEPFTRSFNTEHYYNPITDARINNNTDLIENPGY